MQDLISPHADEEAGIRARIQGKSCALVEAELLPEFFRGLRDPDTSMGTKIAIGRVLMDLGNLTPKKDATPVQHGSKFSVTINLPGQAVSQVMTIEAEPVETIDGIAPRLSLGTVDDNDDLMGGLDG